MQYEDNYLKNVIFRIDFAKPLSRNKQLVDKFSNLVKLVFPKKDNVTHTIVEAQILTQKDGNRVTQSTQKVTDYRLSDEDQMKILMLEPSSNVNLVFNIYKNSTELKEIIGLIIDSVIKVYGDIKIKRTGLRYINDIVLPEGSPFDWDSFINHSLISSLAFLPENKNLSR
ncbi:MAG: TIGR04255 family protein [Methanotrichaceae archaeon]